VGLPETVLPHWNAEVFFSAAPCIGRKSARDARLAFGETCRRNRRVTDVLCLRLETIAR
jgi:hypothetical protein